MLTCRRRSLVFLVILSMAEFSGSPFSFLPVCEKEAKWSLNSLRNELKLREKNLFWNDDCLIWYLPNLEDIIKVVANSLRCYTSISLPTPTGGSRNVATPQAPAVLYTLIIVASPGKSSRTLAFPDFPSVHPSQEALLQMFKHYTTLAFIAVCVQGPREMESSILSFISQLLSLSIHPFFINRCLLQVLYQSGPFYITSIHSGRSGTICVRVLSCLKTIWGAH